MTLQMLLEDEKDNLKRKIQSLEICLKNAPKGQMRISHSNGCAQFYFRNASSTEIPGYETGIIHDETGIIHETTSSTEPGPVSGTTDTANRPKRKPAAGNKDGYYYDNDRDLAKAIAQRDYNKRLLKDLKARYNTITRTLSTYDHTDPEKVIQSFGPDRRNLIGFCIANREDYIKQWLNEEYPKKLFSENTPEIYTMNGERVRSKSEKIIADTLCRYNVPYRYEFPLELKGFGLVHPDFMIMNLFTRAEFLYEHFGMMDDEIYIKKALKKIEAYEKNDYFLGQELIVTFETKTMPLNIKILEKIIKRNFL